MGARRATMSVASGDLGDVTGGHIKIGVAHHYLRNVAIGAAAIVMALGVVAYSSYSSRKDAGKLADLEAFRGAYAEKCEAADFNGEAAPLVRDTYLRSDRLQAAVAKQRAALEAGAPCDEIARSLKAADFPMVLKKP
jgi:hypothetical protein